MSSPPTSDEDVTADNAVQASTDPLAGVPELVTYPTTSTPERILALRLITDSIAQQRQLASRSLIYNPIILSVYFLAIAITFHFLYRVPGDFALVCTTSIGITMAFLVAARWATSGYLRAAEGLRWSWLEEEDLVVVTRFGEEIIGVAVIRIMDEGARAEVRGWAVRMRFRGKGVGGALLEEGVRLAREKMGEEGEIVFADDHASQFSPSHIYPLQLTHPPNPDSLRILPDYFNGPFAKREARARKALEKILEAPPASGKAEDKTPIQIPTPGKTGGSGRKARKR
jgi:Acetyltransferase (GNAT) family